MPDYIPKPDGDAVAYTDTLITALEADEVAFGILPADSLALRAAHTAFEDALNVANTKKGEAQIAVANKDTSRSGLEQALRPVVAQIQVNPVVTDANRVAAGIPIRDTTRTFSNPITPTDLVATADAAGTNSLKWSDAGNATGIQYVVEAKIGAAVEFVTVDVVTARTFRHTGRTPGQKVEYRVRARRGSAISDPSNVAVVYPS
jgi:hypothetical protein